MGSEVVTVLIDVYCKLREGNMPWSSLALGEKPSA